MPTPISAAMPLIAYASFVVRDVQFTHTINFGWLLASTAASASLNLILPTLVSLAFVMNFKLRTPKFSWTAASAPFLLHTACGTLSAYLGHDHVRLWHLWGSPLHVSLAAVLVASILLASRQIAWKHAA